MNIPLRAIWRLSFGRNKDSALISPKCPWESPCLRETAIWLTSLFKAGHFIWEGNGKMKGPSVYLAKAHSSLTFCIFEDESEHNNMLSQCTHITSRELRGVFQRVCTVIVLWSCVSVGCSWMCWRIPKVKSHLYHKPQLLLRLVATSTTICWSSWKLGHLKDMDLGYITSYKAICVGVTQTKFFSLSLLSPWG